jgi:hypothetical protein
LAGGTRWISAAAILAGIFLSASPVDAQRAFREYPGVEGDATASLPSDYDVPAEFVLGRLMFPAMGRWGRGNWKEGESAWTVDYPLGDRNYLRHLRRLSTADVRSVEQPVDLDDGDDVFNWPFLLASFVGEWNLTQAQAAKLRDYLLRGGFLMCDSFFGTAEWEGFEDSMRRVFPDRPIVELTDDSPIFHTVYDLPHRTQVRNGRALRGGGPGYRRDGVDPHWRAILDDDGRIMVAITFNNDLGDAWQYANVAEYPQEDTNLGIRLGVNFAIYAMTH